MDTKLWNLRSLHTAQRDKIWPYHVLSIFSDAPSIGLEPASSNTASFRAKGYWRRPWGYWRGFHVKRFLSRFEHHNNLLLLLLLSSVILERQIMEEIRCLDTQSQDCQCYSMWHKFSGWPLQRPQRLVCRQLICPVCTVHSLNCKAILHAACHGVT